MKISEYVKGKKSFGDYIRRRLKPDSAEELFYREAEKTRIRLLQEITAVDEKVTKYEDIVSHIHDLAVCGHERMYLPFHMALYMLCKLLDARAVVETGVGRGFSSFVILKALNGRGWLYSLELDHQIKIANDRYAPVGFVVGWDYKLNTDNWKLIYGNSLDTMPKLVDELAQDEVDLFVAGSSHEYHVQKAELQYATSLVRDGGIIVCDRPDYNDYLALSEALNVPHHVIKKASRFQVLVENNYEVVKIPERNVYSSLDFAIVRNVL